MTTSNRYALVGSLLLAGVAGAYAAPLTPDQALQRARQDSRMPARAAAAVKAQPQLVQTVTTQQGQPAVYVFETQGDSFLMLGADDLAAPVLGFGDKADGQIPPQLQWWLDSQAAQIAWADSVARNAPRRLQESAPARAPQTAQIGPLLSTFWNQMDPYNLYTPSSNGQNAPTGCAATALAQVMKFHEYPASGTGEGQATFNGQSLTRSLDVEFDWANMLDAYDYYSPFESKKAVADLMVTVGYALNMKYAPKESSASTLQVPIAVVNNFKYDNSAWLYQRDQYSLTEWQNMLVDELVQNGPIFYRGSAPEGGHAFVCDGYDGEEYFHFNWGWGGAYDGWFLIDALNPEGQGTGGYEGGYNTMQMALLNLRLPVSGSVRPQMQLTQLDDVEWSLSNKRLTLNSGTWYSMDLAEDMVFGLSLMMKDLSDNSMTELYNYATDYELPMNYGFSINGNTFSLPTVSDGEYLVQIMTKEQGYNEWLPAKHDYGATSAAKLVVQNGSYALVSDTPVVGQLTFTDGVVTDIYYDKPSVYSFTANNSGQTELSAQVALALVQSNYIVAKTDAHTITVPGMQTQSFTYTDDWYYSESFVVGYEYWVVLYDPNSMQVLCDLGHKLVDEWREEGEFYITDTDVQNPIYEDEDFNYSFSTVNTADVEGYIYLYPALIDTEAMAIMAMKTSGDEYYVTAYQSQDFSESSWFDYYDSEFVFGKPYSFALLIETDAGYSIVDFGPETVVIQHEVVKPTFTCTDFVLEGDNQNVDRDDMRFSAQVTCTNMDVVTSFLFSLWDGETDQLIGSLDTDVLSLTMGVPSALSMGVTYSGATPGASYYAAFSTPEGEIISDRLYFRIAEDPGDITMPECWSDSEILSDVTFSYGFTISNTTNGDYNFHLNASLVDRSSNSIIAMDETGVEVTSEAQTTKTFDLSTSFDYYSQLFEYGKDYAFCILQETPDGWAIVCEGNQVRVTEPVIEAELEVLSFRAVDAEIIDSNEVTFEATLISRNAPSYADLTLRICGSGALLEQYAPFVDMQLDQDVATTITKTVELDQHYTEAGSFTYYGELTDLDGNVVAGPACFTLTVSGVETVADGRLSLVIDPANARSVATSANRLTRHLVTTADGLQLDLQPETGTDGRTSVIDLSGIKGLVIVTATDDTGATLTRKAAL